MDNWRCQFSFNYDWHPDQQGVNTCQFYSEITLLLFQKFSEREVSHLHTTSIEMDPNKTFQILQPLPISQMHSTPFRELTKLTPIAFSQMQTPTGLFDNTLAQPGSPTKSPKQLTPSPCFESAQPTAMFSINEDEIMTEFASSGSQEFISLNPPLTMPISTPSSVHQPANPD